MTKQEITEESGIQKEWMEQAKNMTLDDLPEFLRRLTEDYEHDYGTICHAIASAAVAAAWAVERSPQGGITGFQAGAVTWEILRGWNSSMIGETGTRIQNFDNLLFPQYEDQFISISKEAWDRVQQAAKENLKDKPGAAPNVVAHWESVAAGKVPFGLSVAA